ncbi:class I SAM-dependent methyltransferase [Devosia neptuniae]|uniref:class I SAM-dependent DNA methyltransferase n=1 Tax=Devosia neptuniae TaxID=191302 RepID=UPI0022B03D86|nr:class I SAM-dependent methyltransferase [Devosia neptuniae]MCZ4346751.1 class I SAM-dependent methyltransferase [Devosia neptuniae]|tara:strand:- start:28606 stop:29376 length:771 start_codon:yes stop_codon:yes gene_type:complete
MSAEIFDEVSVYYDLLYRDKPYKREAQYLNELIARYAPNAKTIVDLGCGTGRHDWLLAEFDYNIVGIDQSETMLEIARRGNGLDPAYPPTFRKGNLTDFSVDSKVDVVLSLFDVMSYLTSYSEFKAALGRVRAGLKLGGIFIFDCWYAPAVHNHRPAPKVRRLESDTVSLVRVTSPEFDAAKNVVRILYDVFVTPQDSQSTRHFQEHHEVRCFFEEELVELLAGFGFRPLFQSKWFSDEAPNLDTWSALYGFECVS